MTCIWVFSRRTRTVFCLRSHSSYEYLLPAIRAAPLPTIRLQLSGNFSLLFRPSRTSMFGLWESDSPCTRPIGSHVRVCSVCWCPIRLVCIKLTFTYRHVPTFGVLFALYGFHGVSRTCMFGVLTSAKLHYTGLGDFLVPISSTFESVSHFSRSLLDFTCWYVGCLVPVLFCIRLIGFFVAS